MTKTTFTFFFHFSFFSWSFMASLLQLFRPIYARMNSSTSSMSMHQNNKSVICYVVFFSHRNVNSFILHRTWWFVWLRSAVYNYNERSSYSKSQCQRRRFEDNNIQYWPTPAESPDMNPLKLPWHELKTFACVALSSQLTRTNLSRASIGSGTLGLLLSAVNTLATSEKLLLLWSNAKEEPGNSFL